MLRLASETPARWAHQATHAVDTLLIDHAHCEKKAASTAINLIFRYMRQPWLARPLSALAEEELQHFQLMLDVLDARGVPFGPLAPSAYAGRLIKACRKEEPGRLVDTLLCCALIEARSCERMKLLSQTLPDPTLASLYADLLASEARHHQTYIDLAVRAASGDRAGVLARLATLADHEAAVLATDDDPFRMHSGCLA